MGNGFTTPCLGGGNDHDASASTVRHGTYYVSLFARDNAGNLSVPTPGVSSVEFTVDHSPPSISILAPADGSTVTNILSISGTAKDSKSLETVRLYLYRFSDGQFWDGNAWGGGGSAILPVTVDTNSGAWTSSGNLPSNLSRDPARRLSNGGYNIIAFAVDSAGNQTRSDAVVTVEYFIPVTYTAGSHFDSIPNNNNDNWDNPANWDMGFVPGPEDIAMVPAHAVVFAGTKTVHGLRQTGGEIRGGKILVPENGDFTWGGGTLSTDVTINYGATFRVTGGGAKAIASGRRIENNGDSEWDGTSAISASGGVVFLNNGTITADGNLTFTYYNNGVYPVGTFLNQGTLLKKGAGVLRFTGDYGGWIFTNAASLNITEGAVNLQNENSFLGGSISGAGRLVAEGANLHLNGTTLLDEGTVELESGTLRGAGTFDGTGTFDWSGGTIDGDIVIGETARLRMSERDRVIATGARLRNRGSAVWEAGKIHATGKSRFENSGRLDVVGEVSAPYYNNGAYPRGEFENTGLVTVNSGQTVTFPADYGGWHFNNLGTARVVSGKLVLAGGGVSSNGVFEAQSGSIELGASGEKHLFSGRNSILGGGRMKVAGAELIGENATFTVAAGTTYEHSAGRADGTFAVEGPGTFVWSGGMLNAAMQWSANLKAEISGSEQKVLQAGRITNYGNVVWTGAGTLHAVGQGEFRNEGTFEMQNDSSFYYYNNGVYPVGRFVNTGTLRKTSATGATTFRPDYGGWAFLNTGLIDIQSGTLDLHTEAATLGDKGRFMGAGSVRIIGGNATLAGTNTVENGTVELVDGGLSSSEGRIGGPGAFVWSGGRFNGAINVAATNFAMRGAADKVWTTGSTVRNYGSANWSGLGALRFTGATFLENYGRLDAREDGSLFYYNNGVYPKGAVRNFGVFLKSGGTNNTTLHEDYGGAHFHNQGTIEVQSGRLNLGGGGDWEVGTVVARPGSEINLFSGSFQTLKQNTFAGAISVRGAELVLGGSTNSVTADSSIHLVQGALLGNGLFDGAGALEWSGGRIAANVQIARETSWRIQGSDEKLFQTGTIDLFGKASWTGAGPLKATGAARLNNYGEFALLSDAAFTYYNNGVFPRGRFHNAGLFSKSGSAGISTFSEDYGGWEFSNNGTIQIDAGVLRLVSENIFTNSVVKGAGRIRVDGGAVHFYGNTALEGGTFDLSAGYIDGESVFSGSGTFDWRGGELRGTQTIAPGGRMVLTGGEHVIAGSSALLNNGTLIWTAGPIRGVGQSRLINSGTFQIECDSEFLYYNNGVYPVGLLENKGTIRKSSAMGRTTVREDYGGWKFLNSGMLEVLTGVFSVGPLFEGAPSAQYAFVLAGPESGTQFGSLEFVREAPLGGSLKVALASGYVPTGTNSYALITYPSRNGQFASTEFPPAGSGSAWTLAYGAKQAELKLATLVEARNTSFGRTPDGSFQLSLKGPAGTEAWLQSSTNLVDWMSLQTNKPFSGEIQFVDPTATNRAKFYRTLILP